MTVHTTTDTPPASPGQAEEAPRASRSTRHTFTTEFKARVVAEYDVAPTGSKGRALHREGLYGSNIKEWRQQIEAGTLGRPVKRKPKASRTPEQIRIANWRSKSPDWNRSLH